MNKSPRMPYETFAGGLRKFCPAYPIVTALLGLVYFFALHESFDYVIGHFDPSPLFILLMIFTVAGVLISAIPAWLAKYTVSVTDVPRNNLLSVFAVVLGAVLALLLSVNSLTAFTPDTTVIEKLEAVTLPALALSLILSLFPEASGWLKTLRQLAAILGVLTVNLTMFVCYFDPTVPINSPVRNLTVMVHAAVILFLLSEARLTFGVDSNRITTPFYLFSAGTASTLGGGIALGGILNRLLTAQEGDPNLSLLRLGLYLALALLAMSRLFALPPVLGKFMPPPPKDKNSKPIQAKN